MKMKIALVYTAIFVATVILLSVLPRTTIMVWQPEVMIPLSGLLYTLLVYLSCQLVDIHRPEGIILTALFLMIFLPEAKNFLTLDIEAVIELSSQCIVPFFIGQYNRASQKSFKYIYTLMLLMGIFCSYTHNGITIPLCAGFLWMSILHRDKFFRTACWPMVTGFLIGTAISIWQAVHEGRNDTPNHLQQSISQTAMALQTLWDTKIFLLSVGLTAYLSVSRWGRLILISNFRKHTLLSCCAMFSYCTLPFAPLGLENAVTGVCFFCMYWVLIIAKALAHKFYYKEGQGCDLLPNR